MSTVAVFGGYGTLRLATRSFPALAAIGSGYGERTARFLERLGRFAPPLGCSGGAVMTELFFSDGTARLCALVARQDGQRIPHLPCALAADEIVCGAVAARGAMTAYEAIGPDVLLKLAALEFTL